MLEYSLTAICGGCDKKCEWCRFTTEVIVPQVIKMGYYLSHFKFERNLRLKSAKTVPQTALETVGLAREPPKLPAASRDELVSHSAKRAGMKSS